MKETAWPANQTTVSSATSAKRLRRLRKPPALKPREKRLRARETPTPRKSIVRSPARIQFPNRLSRSSAAISAPNASRKHRIRKTIPAGLKTTCTCPLMLSPTPARNECAGPRAINKWCRRWLLQVRCLYRSHRQFVEGGSTFTQFSDCRTSSRRMPAKL